MAFARSEARMQMPAGTITYRRQLQLAATARRPNAKAIKELADAPTCPPEFEDIWLYYAEIKSMPVLGMHDIEVSWPVVESWARMTRRNLQRYELELIAAVHTEFSNEQHARRPKPKKKDATVH